MGVRGDRARVARRFCRSRVEKLVIFSDMDNQRLRILTSKGSRADTLLEMSNARQSEPQRADLNLHTRTYQPSATPHVHLLRGRVQLH